MIDIHGGRIWLEDQEKGACFSFALPAFEDDLTTETILIIDDDIHTLRMLHRSITQLGYDVVTATEGKEAMEKSRSIPAAPGGPGYPDADHERG